MACAAALIVGTPTSSSRSGSIRSRTPRSRIRVVVRQQARASAIVEISRMTLPDLIKRDDFSDHLFKWACVEFEGSTAEEYALPMSVERVDGKGFIVSLLSSDPTSDMEVSRIGGLLSEDDQDYVITQMKSNVELDQESKAAALTTVNKVIEKIGQAVNLYYAFGSCFVEDI